MRKEGLKFILPLAGLSAWFFWNSGCEGAWAGWMPLSVLAGLLALFCLNFFRDPVRAIPANPSILVSPADGKVIAIEEVKDPHVGKAIEIRVFLNVFDVHVQRSPFTSQAQVTGVRYHEGKFLNAAAPKASLLNEQNWIYMKSASGMPVVVKQIAGLVARRILCFVEAGQNTGPGEHVGLIQFGSQVDLVFPAGNSPLVEIGQRVVGGETPMVALNAGAARRVSAAGRKSPAAAKKKSKKKAKAKKR